MKYKFNLKIQLTYAIVTAAVSFLILYLLTKEINWITPGIIGVGEFIISGFYTQKPDKKKK